jgi:hypothetical protein
VIAEEIEAEIDWRPLVKAFMGAAGRDDREMGCHFWTSEGQS